MRFLLDETGNAKPSAPPGPELMATEFEHAASFTQNARERQLLLERAAACSRAVR